MILASECISNPVVCFIYLWGWSAPSRTSKKNNQLENNTAAYHQDYLTFHCFGTNSATIIFRNGNHADAFRGTPPQVHHRL